SFPWRRNRESGGGAADAHDRLLHAAQQAAAAAEGGRAFAEGHDRRTDHGDRNRRTGDRRPQAHRARRQRKSRQPVDGGDADVGASEEHARRRRRRHSPAVQDRDRGAALAGGRTCSAGSTQGFFRQGGCRGGLSILRTQKGQWPRRMKSFRDIRVIPVVLVAIFGLAVLKIAGLVIDGGYVFDYQVSQPAKRSWAQDNLGYPSTAKADTADITGSVKKEEKKE